MGYFCRKIEPSQNRCQLITGGILFRKKLNLSELILEAEDKKNNKI